ncbi:MAG: hypothetical protein B6I36_09735 [Desulfobacteraceae bacterium 4572_35.1]|nr:MAG: hypothetical protein B6I36_09735 [Desulfobacteraceae bacterium 4572_35.1]
MCPLSKCHNGETVYIKSINGGAKLRGKLHAMGLMPGDPLEIISSNNGPLLVQSRGIKLAIGLGMAENIMVACNCSCPRYRERCHGC